MSGKAPLPSLTGHRLKTRKRDEKKQYDPLGFRDAILEGLSDCGGNLESAAKILDAAGSKLDYRRYGVSLIEILISGGLLAPGGSLLLDGEPPHKTAICLFDICVPGDTSALQHYESSLFVKLMRRYKYLEKMHEEEMNKLLVYLKGFSQEHRTTLAEMTALWLSSGQLPATLLPTIINEQQIKDGTALEFLLVVLDTLKTQKGSPSVVSIIKKSGIGWKLLELFPAHDEQVTKDNFVKTFSGKNLTEVVTYKKQMEETRRKNHVQRHLQTSIIEEKPAKEIVQFMKKNIMSEYESIAMIWDCVMSAIEWSKKEDLLQDQALRHIRRHVPLFKAFSEAAASERGLISKIQEFCYDNMNFLKTFNKIIVLLYKTNVLSEDVILRWYKEGSSQRGCSVFMDQMKKFIEWLEMAEEESEEEDD
uniref:Extra bases n=1 Tax=Caligus clemensi TaxID=344056 RepID=C1C0Z4_CALCM|nr:extra bases [Caligus clemensi]